MVEKLNDMIKHRYGKGLSIRRLAGIGQELTQEISLRGEDLYIPIFVKDIFLGYGLVHEARDLSTDDHDQVARLVRMILEPHLYSQHLEKTLVNFEIEKSIVSELEEASKVKGMFLYGNQSKLVQKVSLEIHELSQHMSYLPFNAVSSGINSLTDLESLSDSTLVVDLDSDILSETQIILADYLSSTCNGPLIIFVASRPAALLKIEEKLSSALKSIEFAVDRMPLDKNAMNQVLEMMYFKS